MAVVKEFGADSELKTLYHVYSAVIVVGGFLWWMVPVVVFAVFSFEVWIGVAVALPCLVPILIAAVVTLYWIPKFYSTR